MIHVIGDVHGDADAIIRAARNLSPGDTLAICGDAGLGFAADTQAQLDRLAALPVTIVYVDGNHEPFDYLNALPVERWHGGLTHVLRPNIRHLMRGEVFEVEGKTILAMGGALSQNRIMGRPGVDWWPEEVPDRGEMLNAWHNLERVKGKVNVILSHTVPGSMLRLMGYSIDPREALFLAFLDELYTAVDFDDWYAGHLHEDRRFGKLTLVYQEVLYLA